MKKTSLLAVIACVLFLSSCAPNHNPYINVADIHGDIAGFWMGLWHGIISPITLIASVLADNHINIYEVNNNGGGYNVGFLLGIFCDIALILSQKE